MRRQVKFKDAANEKVASPIGLTHGEATEGAQFNNQYFRVLGPKGP